MLRKKPPPQRSSTKTYSHHSHHSIPTFVLLVVLSLSSFNPVSGQSYRHSRSSVFSLVTTLSARDIVVGIRLLVAFGFPVMLPLTSLALSSPMLIPLMSRLIFLTWFGLRMTLFPLCLHHYHYLLHRLPLHYHHYHHVLPFYITILVVHVLHNLPPLLPSCMISLHALQFVFLSLPPIEMLLLILSGNLLWLRRLLLLTVLALGILFSALLLLFQSRASGTTRSRLALMVLLSALKRILFLMVFSSCWYPANRVPLCTRLKSGRRHLLCQSNHKTQVIWKGRGDLLCYSPTFPLLRASRGCWCCLLPLRRDCACGPSGC
jgi:hypothetical protein